MKVVMILMVTMKLMIWNNFRKMEKTTAHNKEAEYTQLGAGTEKQ